jgi:hypothetical protein
MNSKTVRMTKLQDERLRFAWKQINPIIEEKTFDLGNMKRFSGLHAGKKPVDILC